MATTQREPNITINKRKGQNQCFDQALGKDVVLRMMQIPAGRFLMGSPEGELERQSREGPQHPVEVRSFCMGKYPVTQAQWRFVAGLEPIETRLDPDPSRFKGDDRPVEQVNWHEAMEFCKRLSNHIGRDYRLPSEAEWEYACRAGTTTPFHFGETITTDLANYAGSDEQSGTYGPGSRGISRGETTPVGQFEVANTFGLCDMHGNVLEWCQDEYHDSYEGAPEDGSAWGAGGDGKYAVLRGGSWDFFPRSCRSAFRGDYQPDDRGNGVGFRVVCRAPRTLATDS